MSRFFRVLVWSLCILVFTFSARHMYASASLGRCLPVIVIIPRTAVRSVEPKSYRSFGSDCQEQTIEVDSADCLGLSSVHNSLRLPSYPAALLIRKGYFLMSYSPGNGHGSPGRSSSPNGDGPPRPGSPRAPPSYSRSSLDRSPMRNPLVLDDRPRVPPPIYLRSSCPLGKSNKGSLRINVPAW